MRSVGTSIEAKGRVKQLELPALIYADTQINIGGVAHNGVEILLTRVEQFNWATNPARD